MNDLNSFFASCAGMVEAWLDEKIVTYHGLCDGLTEGMRYSLFAGGKRIRPALMYASFGVFSDRIDTVTPFAASIEILHTYSLIHDDLPAMDDDDLRRGKPTNHKVFGEASAILTGDALLTKAFEIVADTNNSPEISADIRLKIVNELAKAAGDSGMVAGQYVDIVTEGKSIPSETLEFIHLHKTAALLGYSTSVGALLAGKAIADYEKLLDFGRKLGIVFQIIDDILDVTGTPEELGKPANSDAENDKTTYPVLYGIEKSYQIAESITNEAIENISEYGERASVLRDIALMIYKRKS